MSPRPSLSVSIILLAAGDSRRLGRPKQLLPYRGTTPLRFSANEAVTSNASQVIVVLGRDDPQILKELDGLPVRIVRNTSWRKGISSSIKVGLKTAGAADAVLLMLSDQPFVTTAVLNSIIDSFDPARNPLVACEYASTVGVPALFGKEFFEELSALKGDTGAKKILRRHLKDVRRVPFPSGSIDIDTREDLERIWKDVMM